MTTSVSGWPKLSHLRFKSAVRLLVLSVGVVAAAGRAGAQSQADDPFLAPADATSRAIVRRPASPERKEAVVTPTESTRGTQRKTWKELARAHNEEKSREPQTSEKRNGTLAEQSLSDNRHATLSPLTVVSALAVVICLILVLARVFRRHAPLFSQALPTEALEVLGRRFLDQRPSIVLLRIGSRILVVGSSAAGLQGLGELSDPVEVDLIAGMCRTTRNGQGLGMSFLNLLKGQGGPQSKARPKSGPPRRRGPQVTDSGIPDESPAARISDPEQELMRRLRSGSAGASSHSGGAEVFRE